MGVRKWASGNGRQEMTVLEAVTKLIRKTTGPKRHGKRKKREKRPAITKNHTAARGTVKEGRIKASTNHVLFILSRFEHSPTTSSPHS